MFQLKFAQKKVWHTEDSGSWARQCWLVENSEDGLYRNLDNNTVTGSCGSKGENRGVEYLLSSTEGPGPGLACVSFMLDDDSRLWLLAHFPIRTIAFLDKKMIRSYAIQQALTTPAFTIRMRMQ